MEEQDWVVEVMTEEQMDEIQLREAFKEPSELRGNVETCCCITIGVRCHEAELPTPFFARVKSPDWRRLLATGREEWSDEVDAAKVMIALSMAALARRIEARMNWARKCGNMNEGLIMSTDGDGLLLMGPDLISRVFPLWTGMS